MLRQYLKMIDQESNEYMLNDMSKAFSFLNEYTKTGINLNQIQYTETTQNYTKQIKAA